MNLSGLAVKRPVTTVMLTLIVVAVGGLSLFNINLDMLPNMNIPIAVVSTTYSGAGPEEVENLITSPLEGVLSTVPGASDISSISSYGSSVVIIQFEDGTDIDVAALDMRERVDMIKDYLPDAAGTPMVLKIDIMSMSAISIGVTSETRDLVELKRLVEDRIQGRIERQDGVASVSISGGQEKEINVVLNEERLRGYGISESTVSQMLMVENLSIPTGDVMQGDKRLTLRVSGEFAQVSDIENIPFATSGGGIIYLRDFADVSEVFKEPESVSYINDTPSVTLTIQKQSTSNMVNVSNAVQAELALIQAEMPDIHAVVLIDPADYIRFSLRTVSESAVVGGILAIIVLFIFLRNIRTTLVIAVSMPVSIIATFVLMYYADISLNMMSLGGLTLGVGMLADNSIVVLESIYRKLREGNDRKRAAIEGAGEVAMAITASTLTTVAVFLPISFSGGLTAQIFNQLALTICFSLISSLAVALTFVPMASSLLLRPETDDGAYKRANVITRLLSLTGRAIEKLEEKYGEALGACLRHRFITCLVVVLFVGGTMITLNYIGQEFMPETDEGSISINISLPRATVLEETQKTALYAADLIKNEYPEIEDISISIGGGGISMMGMGGSTDAATITVNLTDKLERTRSAQELASDISKRLSVVAGAQITVDAVDMSMGSFAGGDIELNIKGDDFDTLTAIAGDIRDIVAEIPGTRDVETSVEDTSPQATIRVNRGKASLYGISAYSVSTVISTAVEGAVPTTLKRSGDEFDIRIRQNKDNLDYITDIQNILIPSPYGVNVPLYEIADIEINNMPAAISRADQQRYVSVSAKLDGRDSESVMSDITAKLADYPMPEYYTWEEAGTYQRMIETFSDLGVALIMALALVYMILAAQFESLLYPFIVLFSVPVALTGGIFGLFVMGENLSITGFLGLIMLAGIVVNNAIVLIDYTNLLVRERGMNVIDALKKAGPVRMRPILMTTLTTVLALIPMIMAKGQGSELMRGLSTVVMFGLSLSTLVTLLFVPVVYSLFSKLTKEKGADEA